MQRILKYVLFFAFIALALYAISNEHADAASVTWKQTAGNFASNNANWENGTAPTTGDDVYFTSLSTSACTWDVTSTVRSINIKSTYSGTITQGSNINIGTGGYNQAAGTFTASTSYWMATNGVSVTGGTVTANVLNLWITNGNFAIAADVSIKNLRTTGNVGLISSPRTYNVYILTIDSGSVLTLTGSVTLQARNDANGFETITNNGQIIGGYFYVRVVPTTWSLNLGYVNSIVYTYARSSASGNVVLTLTGSSTFNTWIVKSEHATYTMTVNLNGYDFTTVNTNISTRGILLGSGNVLCSKNFDSYNGTTSGAWSLSIGGTGYIKTPAGNTINGLTITSGNVRLASNVNATKQFIMTGGAITNGGKYIDIKNGCNVTIASGCSYGVSFSHYWNRVNITGTLMGTGGNSIWCNASSAVNGTMTSINVHVNAYFTFRGTITTLIIETAYRTTFFANGTASIYWNLTNTWNFRPYTSEYPGYVYSKANMYYIEPVGGYYIYVTRFNTAIQYRLLVTHWGNETWEFRVMNIGASPTVFTFEMATPDVDDDGAYVYVDDTNPELYPMSLGVLEFTSNINAGVEHDYMVVSNDAEQPISTITNDMIVILGMSFTLLALLTYAAFRAQPFYIIAGFAWITVALFEVQPIQNTIALLCVGVGLIFMLWGVYKLIDS